MLSSVSCHAIPCQTPLHQKCLGCLPFSPHRAASPQNTTPITFRVSQVLPLKKGQDGICISEVLFDPKCFYFWQKKHIFCLFDPLNFGEIRERGRCPSPKILAVLFYEEYFLHVGRNLTRRLPQNKASDKINCLKFKCSPSCQYDDDIMRHVSEVASCSILSCCSRWF